MKDLKYAPPSLVTADNRQAVFVDFVAAHYTIVFDPTTPDARAESKITFDVEERGFPVISLKQPFVSGTLNGKPIALDKLISSSLDDATTLCILSHEVSRGRYELNIDSRISRPVVTRGHPVVRLPRLGWVDCKFSMSDMKPKRGNPETGFLDAYLPSNLEYDHVKMHFSVRIVNSTSNHHVFSNGEVSCGESQHWEIDFPEFFTCSCPWFHIGPSDIFRSLPGVHESTDKRQIPIFVYSYYKWLHKGVNLDEFMRVTKCHLSELERDFGPFPHGSLVIFARRPRSGGMEYAGATATSMEVLRHELDHSYFARSITPVNGDAGWMDEAIARWGDRHYNTRTAQPDARANLGRRSMYMSTTNRQAYDVGSEFLAYLDFVLSTRGGVKAFLRHYAKEKKFCSISANEFQTMLAEFAGDIRDDVGNSIDELFEHYVYSEEPTLGVMSRETDNLPGIHESFDDLVFELDAT